MDTLTKAFGLAGWKDRRFCKPPAPPTFGGSRTALAFCEGEHCVVVMVDEKSEDGDVGQARNFSLAFAVRKPMPDGKWMGSLEVPEPAFRSMKALIDQANDCLEAASDEE